MLVTSILGALVQIAVVMIIGGILFLFIGRGKSSFFEFLGLTRAPARVVLLGLAIGAAAALALLFAPGFSSMAKGPGTVPGEALKYGLSEAVIAALIITAIFKTAFAEELLFRGIIGRRLIARLGFRAGNLIQATLFGALHLLLALTPLATGVMVASVVVFSGALGWINGWLNERRGGGSILPGWATHAAANLCSYLSLAFGLL
jgi:membrane protease YdiL (CAAX protease family)